MRTVREKCLSLVEHTSLFHCPISYHHRCVFHHHSLQNARSHSSSCHLNRMLTSVVNFSEIFLRIFFFTLWLYYCQDFPRVKSEIPVTTESDTRSLNNMVEFPFNVLELRIATRLCLSILFETRSQSLGAWNSHTKPMSRHFYRLIYS